MAVAVTAAMAGPEVAAAGAAALPLIAVLCVGRGLALGAGGAAGCFRNSVLAARAVLAGLEPVPACARCVS